MPVLVPSGKARYTTSVDPFKDRITYDGTLPYGIEACGSMGFDSADDSTSTYDGTFCLLATPDWDGYNFDDPDVNQGMVREATCTLSGFWISLFGNFTVDLSVAICNPANAFPTYNEQLFLYNCSVRSSSYDLHKIEIPDIEKIIVPASTAAPLNIVVHYHVEVPPQASKGFVNYHCLTTLDD